MGDISNDILVLDTMLEVFGPDGEHWGQMEYMHDQEGYALDRVDADFSDVCMLGAAAVAVKRVFDIDKADIDELLIWSIRAPWRTALDTVAEAESGTGIEAIGDFNDAPERQFSEIREAILKAKERLLVTVGPESRRMPS